MAIFKSNTMTQASGSVGGTTYTRTGRGSLVMRARTVPVNPNTGNQVEVRAAFTELVNEWIEILSVSDRNSWNVYAANVPVVNRVGDTINLTGQNWFIGANTPRLQAVSKLNFGGTGVITAASPVFDRGTFTTPTFTADVSSGISIAWNDTDPWTSEPFASDSMLLVYEGIPKNPSVNFFNGPWRLVALILAGDTPPAVISPSTIANLGYTYADGQNVWLKFELTQGDGRLTTARVVGPVLSVP